MDIKAHSVALVGEPRVLRRDATTGASTGAVGALPLLALLQANVDPRRPGVAWDLAICRLSNPANSRAPHRTWGGEPCAMEVDPQTIVYAKLTASVPPWALSLPPFWAGSLLLQ